VTAQPQTQNEPRKFVHDIIWIAASQILTSFVGIITLPVLTKRYTSATYGIWVQASVTMSLVVPVLTMQFGSAVVRFLAGEDDKGKRRRSLGSMLSAILVFACMILVAANFAAPQISRFLFDNPNYTAFVRLTFLWTLADGLFGFFISYLRARGMMKKVSVVQVAFAASKTAAILVLASSGLGLEWVIAGMAAVELVFAVSTLYLIIRDEGLPILNFVGIRKFLYFSAPEMPTGIFGWITSGSDRYFITRFINLSQTAVYSTSNYLAGFITWFCYPVGYVLLPAISKAWEQNRRGDIKIYFEYSIKLFLTLAIPAATGIVMLSQPLLKILTTSEYLAGWVLVLLLATGTILQGMYMINEYVIYLTQQTKWEPLIMVAAAAVSVGFNYVLIPHVGIIGAAIANVASNFTLAIILFIWAARTIAYRIDTKYVAKVITADLVMALCLHFLKAHGIAGIILSVIAGAAVFAAGLLALRAFSGQDKRLMKQAFSGLIPGLH
jgi:O-antigen/teichoic acid export membrane protein